ncbi:MAG: IPT/TIG domain-containing protein [Acidobacteria bacterium]|nr:IPT/TIG domain-containing protein [Acidobacteriota bacterium]
MRKLASCAATCAAAVVTLFLTEKNPDGPWQSARQHIEWSHSPAHSYVADGTGCYVIIAHPSARQFDDIVSLDLDAMEVNHSGHAELYEELWDRVLTWKARRNLTPIWGTGADDTHSITEIDRSWIALRLESLTEASVKAALRRGSFYASNGPVIRDIQVKGPTVTVSLGQKADVRWLRSGQFGAGPPRVAPDAGQNHCLRFDQGATKSSYTLNADDHTADPAALFIRCIVTTGEAGKAAQTQPFLIRSAATLENPYPSQGEWHKGMTHNHTDLLEGNEQSLRRYASAYAERGHSAAFETQYDYWVTPMARYPGGRTPEITEVVPRTFPANAPVTFEVHGKSFSQGCKVLVDGKVVPGVRRLSETAIRITVTASLASGSHELTVRSPNGLQDTRTQGLWIQERGARTAAWASFSPANSPLGSRYIYSVAADPRAGVWVGTNRGLNYFDGHTWRLFREEAGGALDDTIYDVDPSSADGTCWFTCFRGVGAQHRDGTRERWGWKEAGFPSKQVNQILRTGGATYISTHNRQGFSVLRSGKWSSIRLPQTARGLVTSIVPGPDGKLWLGTTGGVLSWDTSRGEQGWQHYTTANSGLADDYVRRMAFDRRGRLWMGTTTRSESDVGGLCVYDTGRWTVYSPTNSPLPERRVWSVYVDKEDRIWAATSKGAACLRPDGRWSVLKVSNSGLIDNLVTDVAQDTAGNIWFGTAYGVSRMASGGF